MLRFLVKESFIIPFASLHFLGHVENKTFHGPMVMCEASGCLCSILTSAKYLGGVISVGIFGVAIAKGPQSGDMSGGKIPVDYSAHDDSCTAACNKKSCVDL